MSKIELNKSYNSSQIIESTDHKWTAFEGFQGSEVELFLKDKLEDSVVDFQYYNSGFKAPDGSIHNNILAGLNAFGQVVCYTQIINADPTYTADFAFQNVVIGSTTYNAGATYDTIQVNKSDSLTVNTTFKYLLTGNIAGSEFNETSAQSVTFKWFKDASGSEVDATLDTITRTVTPGESITLDITKMYENTFSNRYLGVQFTTPKSDTVITHVFDTPFTLRKLDLSYNGNLVINTNILTNINLDGTDGEDLGTYILEYYLDNTTKNEVNLSSGVTSSLISLTLPNLTEGAHDVFLRVRGGKLTSNYVQVSFIYLKLENSSLRDAVAMVSEVPNEINNCNLSKFFKVVTTANISGNIEIVALKSSNPGNIIGINTIEDAKVSPYLFKEISLTLLNTDESQNIAYTSYIEVPGSTDVTEYLRILVKDGTGVRQLNYYQVLNNSVSKPSYKAFTIVNPKEGSAHLQYTQGELLNFSQITNGNVFTDLSDDLDSSDGLQLETVLENTEQVTMTAFKVSPTKGVFATPKKLLSAGQTALHKGAFSIEMMFKTYGISDLDDKILTIGNITLCPKHLFVNHEPDKNSEPHHTVNASRADFRKEMIQHVLITYDPNYKPSTYDFLYDKFFTSGSTTYTSSAQSYPCLKVYVNGTINRIISIGSSTICEDSDFNFQIHPSNSNINFYIFRTYDKTLSYEEVRKNYTSSMSKLDSKQNYYLDNDILYLASDFPAGQVSEKSDILNTISLGKCINKFKSVSNPNRIYKDRKVLLVALPEGILPPYYGNRKEDESVATFLVHYPNDAEHSGRLAPQSIDPEDPKGVIKAQGSSAKKYMFHNTSFSKFLFTPESEFTSEEPTSYKYYKMPNSDVEIEKLVGKVNYASSMQSHKQGATKLFHEGYVHPESGLDTSWMNGSRKAVLEDEFFYFFVNVPREDLTTITWDYFKQDDGTYNFENCYFLGFQTWGSAKGDKPTSGYDDSVPYYLMLEGADNDNAAANFKTPWASMQIWGNYKGDTSWDSANSTFIESPNSNPEIGKNYYHLFAGGTQNAVTKLWTPDYLTGLLVKDETIVFDPGTESGTSSDKKADAWDVDFGITEGDSYSEDPENLFFVFEDKAKESLVKFAQFYNLIYTFDFSSLLYIPHGTTIDGTSMEVNGKPSYLYKLIFGANCTIDYGDKTVTPTAGDIYRWEKAWPADVMANSAAKWVPAGLYHNGKDWESLNISNICTWYNNAAKGSGTYPEEYAFFAKPEYNNLKAVEGLNYKYILDGDYQFSGYDLDGNELKNMQACMAEAFKIVCHEYLDVNDVSYHQAFIKLVAGTDNRAKNTYFQIVGPIFTNKYTNSLGEEVSLVKIKGGDNDGLKGYVKDDQFYTVTVDNETVTETEDIMTLAGDEEFKKLYYKNTGRGDFKIRLYQDDLDTIFKTDNNGQQVKPYYLLEPPYNRNLEELWGDMHSGFFYNFDLTFTTEVKNQLGKLLLFATGNEWPDTHTTKFHDYFFSIQKNLPSIAYNHHSEIYYESTQTLWQDGKGTPFYEVFSGSGVKSWKDFNNNKVYDPVSLSHGSCIEAEIEYLRDRVLLLSTYTNTAKNSTDTSILLNGGSATTQGSEIVITADYTSFIQYIYPIVNNIPSSKNYTGLDYDPLLDYISWNTETSNYNNIDLVYNIALPNEPLDLSVKFTSSSLTSNSYWTSTDLYRTIHIKTGTNAFSQLFSFPNASTVISQDPAYLIEISESKEVNVVDYLENIEHLVLQNANITSEGLDFTGCNRLKTLILGDTENTLTDSSDEIPNEDKEWYAVKFEDVLNPTQYVKVPAANASVGFNLIILPKSNSVEQVILPNCVKIANIYYYPNLYKFEFNEGTSLSNLTIDGRNNNGIIEYILANFIGSYTENLEITNITSDFWLTEATCRKLALISNVKISGVINIGDGVNYTSIDWTTKKLLVEKFGNINSGDLIFKFKEVSFIGTDIAVNTTGTIESSGPAPLKLTIDGNAIPIDSDNKHLKIYYTIKDLLGETPSTTDIYFVDKYTPQLIIRNGLKGTYVITTQVFYDTNKSKSFDTTITVGFYAPKPGDFAYANGSFSPVCDVTQGLVGIVFYSEATTNSAGKKIYDIRVLSANYSSTNEPLSPAIYANDWSYSLTKKSNLNNYKELLNTLGLASEQYYKDVTLTREGGIPSGLITCDSPIKTNKLLNTTEHTYLTEYIRRANNFVSGLKQAKIIEYGHIEENFSNPTEKGKVIFESILQTLKNTTSIQVNNNSYTSTLCDGFTYALNPGFLKALYYSPNVPLTGKGISYFGIGNWYVPDGNEMARLIYYRIHSSIYNRASTELYWNSTLGSNIDVFGENLNIFNNDAFNNIKFLNDSNELITSVCNDDGEGLTYCDGRYYGESPQWYMSCVDYGNDNCARDENHNISPVCRIELVES